MFLIYGLEVQGKIEYVGQCLARRFDARMSQHRYYNTVETTNFTPIVLFENIPSLPEALEMEKVYIDVHQTYDIGYNKTRGGGRNTEVSDETKAKHSANAQKRVENQTHHMCDSDWHNENNPFLDSDWQKENAQKRVANGTHPWLSHNNPKRGKKLSQETRIKMRKAKQKVPMDPDLIMQYGGVLWEL